MRKHRRRVLWPALVIALLALTAFTFAASRAFRRSKTPGTTVSAAHSPSSSASVDRKLYVRRGMLSPRLVWHLNALGDRLEKPGKERLTVTGTLNRSGELHEVTAVMEFPERLRLTIQKGMRTDVITFDGTQARSTRRPLDAADQDLVDTLIYGSSDHFFMTQMRRQATRFLGTRFRMDDGSDANYNGPYYDIYKVGDQVTTSADERQQEKFYYFNSETLLLERVAYQAKRNGSEVKVEEVLSDWHKEQGQQVARRIERLENGKSVFVFTVRWAGVERRVDDGVFAN